MIRIHKSPAWTEMESQTYHAEFRELCRIFYAPRKGQFGLTARSKARASMTAAPTTTAQAAQRVVFQVLTRGNDSVRDAHPPTRPFGGRGPAGLPLTPLTILFCFRPFAL